MSAAENTNIINTHTTTTITNNNIDLSQKRRRKGEPVLQGKAYNKFIKAINSPKSKEAYTYSLRRYINFLQVPDLDSLLLAVHNKRLLEDQIINYVESLREQNLAFATIHHIVAPIITFYGLNDIDLNKRKISRYFGEHNRVVKDRAYTVEEIYKALQSADIRMKVIILLMSSNGQRIGSLADLKLGSLTWIESYGVYKVVIYEGTEHEYYSFTTRECAIAINDYLLYRQRCSEYISFDNKSKKWAPEVAPLIREQFDGNDIWKAQHPEPTTTNAIRHLLIYHLNRCGIRTVEHVDIKTQEHNPNAIKRIRKSVALSNGLRKWVISCFVRAKVNHEIRQMITDHKAGYLDESYLRLTEEEVLQEFMKAELYLTIDPNVRLSNENKMLTMNNNKLEQRIQRLEEICKDL